MSPKELSYIQDTLGHQKHMKIKCQDIANQIQDVELKNYVNQLADTHKKIFDQIYQLL